MKQLTIKEIQEGYDFSGKVFDFINKEFFDNKLNLHCFCINSNCPLVVWDLKDCSGGYYSDSMAILMQSDREKLNGEILDTFSHELAHLIEHQIYGKDILMTSHCKRWWELYKRVCEIWFCMHLQL